MTTHCKLNGSSSPALIEIVKTQSRTSVCAVSLYLCL